MGVQSELVKDCWTFFGKVSFPIVFICSVSVLVLSSEPLLFASRQVAEDVY